MKISSPAWWLALFATAASTDAAAAPKPAGIIRRLDMYGKDHGLGFERISRAQVDPNVLRRAKWNMAEDASARKQRRHNGASPTPSTCPYSGPQPGTSQCKAGQNTSDGCTSPDYYSVEETSLKMLKGNKLQANGHVNFQYIPLSQYRGYGSKRSPDPQWKPVSAGLHLDTNNNQPGTPWIGRDYFDWSAATSLPAEGYCIIWVQVSNFNAHFGEGGDGPVCYCPKASRRRRR